MTRNEDRMNMRLPDGLKQEMLEYADRHNTTLSAITVKHYTDLLKDEQRRLHPQEAEQV